MAIPEDFKPTTLTPLGIIIRDYRVANNLSLKEMAEAVFLTPASLSGMETGRHVWEKDIVFDLFKSYFENSDFKERFESEASKVIINNMTMEFIDNFWKEVFKNKALIIDESYCCLTDAGARRVDEKFLGFGGRCFKYRKIGVEDWVYSNNLFTCGDLPQYYRKTMNPTHEVLDISRKEFIEAKPHLDWKK